nr:hypothetical protein [Planotetraspora kaengkrachanensis]
MGASFSGIPIPTLRLLQSSVFLKEDTQVVMGLDSVTNLGGTMQQADRLLAIAVLDEQRKVDHGNGPVLFGRQAIPVDGLLPAPGIATQLA